MKWSVCALLLGCAQALSPKRGLSGLVGCDDAKALGLDKSAWSYNWGLWPTSLDAGGNKAPQGTQLCDPPQTPEFVPMFWGCWANCTKGLWDSYAADWAQLGVKYVLGFNEPDNKGQSNLTPSEAAAYWPQLDELARRLNLTLVGPGMTHWDASGGSAWLDEFFGNLSGSTAANIKYLAQHDYSGDAKGIVARADAAFAKYGRQVWLTEFSVGSGAGRAANDKFMGEVLPLLDGAASVFRYAWYSARNAPSGWVNESYLLPPPDAPGWARYSGAACAGGEMRFVSQHGSLLACQADVTDEAGCAAPKTAVYQSGDVRNCYCANTTTCTRHPVTWQDTYVHHGTEPDWAATSATACRGNQMLFLSQRGSLRECQAAAEGDGGCVGAPTKVAVYETGGVQNCYCANATCTEVPSSWQDLFRQPAAPPLDLTPSSTGKLYAA